MENTIPIKMVTSHKLQVLTAKETRMQKFCFSTILSACLLIAAALFSAGCTTRPDKYGVQPFGVVGAEADVYIFAPVSGNEPLLKALLAVFVPEETADRYLSRTSALYVGLRYETEPSITAASVGSYPINLAGLLFSKKDGWEKRHSSGAGDISYYHSETADIEFRSSHNAFVLLGGSARNTEAFLQRISVPQSPAFPLRFQTLIENGTAGEAGVYVRSGYRIASHMLGLQDIELPIQSIELYLKKESEKTYRYSAVFEATNARTALILRVLIGNVMTGKLSVQGSSLFIENADISEMELIKLLRSFYIEKR